MIYDIVWYGIQAGELLAGALVIIYSVVGLGLSIHWRTLKFNYVWGFRFWLCLCTPLWILAFFLQLDFLWNPFWGFFHVEALTQAEFCLSYVTLYHGLTEPAFLGAFVFLMAVHARSAEHSRAPSRWSFVRNILVMIPAILCAIAVVLLNIVWVDVAPAYLARVYNENSLECVTPMLPAVVSAALAIALTVYLHTVAGQVASRVSNDRLRLRLRATQILLTLAFVPAALARVAIPFIGDVGPIVLHAAFASNVFAAFLAIALLVLHPLRTALVQPLLRASCKVPPIDFEQPPPGPTNPHPVRAPSTAASSRPVSSARSSQAGLSVHVSVTAPAVGGGVVRTVSQTQQQQLSRTVSQTQQQQQPQPQQQQPPPPKQEQRHSQSQQQPPQQPQQQKPAVVHSTSSQSMSRTASTGSAPSVASAGQTAARASVGLPAMPAAPATAVTVIGTAGGVRRASSGSSLTPAKPVTPTVSSVQTPTAATAAPVALATPDPRVRPQHQEDEPVRVRATPFSVRVQRTLDRVGST